MSVGAGPLTIKILMKEVGKWNDEALFAAGISLP
jgi:hypothetical protein